MEGTWNVYVYVIMILFSITMGYLNDIVRLARLAFRAKISAVDKLQYFSYFCGQNRVWHFVWIVKDTNCIEPYFLEKKYGKDYQIVICWIYAQNVPRIIICVKSSVARY